MLEIFLIAAITTHSTQQRALISLDYFLSKNFTFQLVSIIYMIVLIFCYSCDYFRYASLYFCCAIEEDDNELLTLEIIHRYVELLDKYFGSVSIL